MQYNHSADTNATFLAEAPPRGFCETFLEAVTVANNVHLRSSANGFDFNSQAVLH